MQSTPPEGVGPPHGPSQSPTASVVAVQPHAMLDIRMFPHIFDMIVSYCDDAALRRLRLSRNLYRRFTPLLARTVFRCDGNDCGGLANGGCAYWKRKELVVPRDPDAPYKAWLDRCCGTFTIAQVLTPTMRPVTRRPLYGLPSGIESADTLVLPAITRKVHDKHIVYSSVGAVDRPGELPRIVWYPTDTHPGAGYFNNAYVKRASEIVINYKHWTGSSDASSNRESLKKMTTLLRRAWKRCAARDITLVAPPEGVYNYINKAFNKRLPGDIMEVSSEEETIMTSPVKTPLRCITLEQYIDERGSLAERIESSTPPEGLGWRTFRFTAKLGAPTPPTSPF